MKRNSNSNNLYNSIKELIENSKSNIARNVNTTIIRTYFDIGRMIVDDEQSGNSRAEYAEQTLKQLSIDLTRDFGKGFSQRNLEYFRKFYLNYSDRISKTPSAKTPGSSRAKMTKNVDRISQTLSAISQTFDRWSHYVLLMKIDNKEERRFYEIESEKNNWSVRELQRQFDSALYKRLALSKDKKGIRDLARKGQIVRKPTDALKHHTVLEFLDLREDEKYSESDLENAIISKFEHFMMELGKGFLFEGRQKRFTFDDDFYVDLVFYNRLLKCFLLLDLKIGRLTHQDIGQIQMYVNYYDRKIKLPDENSTIGIILCKEENKTVVEFTLPKDNKTIFAKEYKLYLPSKEQLRQQLD